MIFLLTHSIKIDNSTQETFVLRGNAFQINTNCFHKINNEIIKTPAHLSNSSFQTKRNNSCDVWIATVEAIIFL